MKQAVLAMFIIVFYSSDIIVISTVFVVNTVITFIVDSCLLGQVVLIAAVAISNLPFCFAKLC